MSFPEIGMKTRIRVLLSFFCLTGVLLSVVSCSESDDTWNPYYNWRARNAEWYEVIADSARTAIADAKKRYGEDWEAHCDWRMIQTYKKGENALSGVLGDTVCVRIVARGTGKYSAAYTDSVSLNFRGWTMPTEYMNEYGELELMQPIFVQTYYGAYNPNVATPQKMAVAGTIDGFATALQYMVEGDDWMVYMPQELSYGAESSSVIPAYSTLLYRMHVVTVHRWGAHTAD